MHNAKNATVGVPEKKNYQNKDIQKLQLYSLI